MSIAKAFDLIEQAKAIVMAEKAKYPSEPPDEDEEDDDKYDAAIMAYELGGYLEEANDSLTSALDSLERYRGESER